MPSLIFGPKFVIKCLRKYYYLLLTFRRTDRSQFEPKVNSFFMFGVRARSASKPTTSIKSFNYYLTRVEELESEMMSMNVREIFNIVKCCIVREISWMRNWWPRRSSHLIKPKPDLTLRRRGYQYIIWLGLVKNTNETFMNSYMNNKLWLIHSNLMLMLTQLTSEKFWVRTPRTSFKISKVKTRLQTNVFDGFWYFLTKKIIFD